MISFQIFVLDLALPVVDLETEPDQKIDHNDGDENNDHIEKPSRHGILQGTSDDGGNFSIRKGN
jgi:hypothetical protein